MSRNVKQFSDLKKTFNSSTLARQLMNETRGAIESRVNVKGIVPIKSGDTQDSFDIQQIHNSFVVSYDTWYLNDFKSITGETVRGRYWENVTGRNEWLGKYFDKEFETLGKRKLKTIIDRKLKKD
jgi:hypothetical protein|nr:MAG TPA: hypothetical protein [Caudoviricetes sp.]